jgi:nicotinamidase-related amidase
MVGEAAAAAGTVANMRAIVAAAREAKMKIFFVQHHR